MEGPRTRAGLNPLGANPTEANPSGDERPDRERDPVGDGPGVPGALPRALRALAEAVGTERLDRIWIFPPLARGRRETGMVAAGCHIAPKESDEPRRLLVTLAYRSEETGKGTGFECSFQEEGEAPSDRLPRIMEGVVRRMKEAPGDPWSRVIERDPERFRSVLLELGDEMPFPDVQGTQPHSSVETAAAPRSGAEPEEGSPS